MRGLFPRMRALFQRRRLDADLEAELAHHLAMKRQRLKQQGLAESEAAREAQRTFGKVTRWKEEIRGEWSFAYLESLASDVGYAVRLLRKDKVFTMVALVTLTLGIGANTAIFSLLDSLIWRPLPVEHPGQIVRLALTNLPPSYREWINGRPVPAKEWPSIWYEMYQELEKRQQVFAGMFATSGGDLQQLEWKGIPRRVFVTVATGSMFPVLGVRARTGRLLSEQDDVASPPSGWVAVIGDGLWGRLFGRSPGAIGAQIAINRVPFTVIGVAPSSFQGLAPGVETEVWVPLHSMESILPPTRWLTDRRTTFLQPMARLRDGVTAGQARQHLAAIARAVLEDAKPPNLSAQEEKYFLAMKFVAESAPAGHSWVALSYRQSLLILLAAVAVVLLIAATNLMNLLLARSTGRGYEIAVRLSLGAPVSRIRRQFLLESLLLALVGTGAGVLAAKWLVSGLQAAVSNQEIAIRIQSTLDWRMLGFIAAVLLMVVLLAGVAPAVAAARIGPQSILKANRGGSRFLGFRRGLIVLQTALCVLLLGGAGLMVTSVRALLTAPTGFLAEKSIFVTPDLVNAGISCERLPRAYERLLEEVRQQPNVISAALTSILPLSGGLGTRTLRVPGRPDLSMDERTVFVHAISDGYFATLGIPLIAGSDLPPVGSRRGSVCVLSESAAQRFFGYPQAAIGQSIDERDHTEVIGVVGDAKYTNIRESAPPTLYEAYGRIGPRSLTLAVRYRGSEESVISSLQFLFRREAGRLPYMQVHTVQGNIADSLGSERLLTWLLAGFAGFALLISATGLAGLLSYMVEQRRKDLGIRMALGATPGRIRREMQSQGLGLTGIGLLCGIVLSYLLRRSLDAFLFGTREANPLIWAAAVLTLVAAAFAATTIPARKAARVDPLAMLREQ
jgi:predicted permease